VKASAENLRVTLQPLGVRKGEDFDRAFASLEGRDVDALIVAAGALTDTYRQKVITLAAKTRLPAMYDERVFVESGGLMSYAANFVELWRRATRYVDKILKGAKPSDLPVEQPTKIGLVISLTAAKQLGIAIPQSVLYRADEVIK
jgi:putative ABC transport system substrate-binding protein